MRNWTRIKLNTWQYVACAIGLCLIGAAPVQAVEWSNLWSSPEQRAAKQFEEQQFDTLIENAPDASWRGLGEFRKGEFEAAAKSFGEQREQAQNAGLATEAERAMYNQANSHVLQENYQEALSVFDELLESNPLHADAKHNRDIAQQLLEQQQQEQQQQESGEQGEQGEQGDENQSESGDNQDQQSEGEQQSENQNSEQDESQQQNQQSGEQQSDGNSQSKDGGDEESSEQASASEQEQAEQDAAAEAAMEAERQRAAQADAQPAENAEQSESPQPATPLTEREQANEQWLRQIPDDPAGLLQRKIQNRHMTDFPEVNNSDQPW